MAQILFLRHQAEGRTNEKPVPVKRDKLANLLRMKWANGAKKELIPFGPTIRTGSGTKQTDAGTSLRLALLTGYHRTARTRISVGYNPPPSCCAAATEKDDPIDPLRAFALPGSGPGRLRAAAEPSPYTTTDSKTLPVPLVHSAQPSTPTLWSASPPPPRRLLP